MPANPPPRSPVPLVSLTRRHALSGLGVLGLGIAAAAVAGCTSEVKAKTAEQAASSDPLGPLYTETVALIGAYDEAITADPATATVLGQLRDEHRQHAIALAGLMGAVNPAISPSPNASGMSVAPSGSAIAPSPSAATLTGLSTAEKTAQASADAACMSTSGPRLATLAAIAACRATHVAALGAMR